MVFDKLAYVCLLLFFFEKICKKLLEHPVLANLKAIGPSNLIIQGVSKVFYIFSQIKKKKNL